MKHLEDEVRRALHPEAPMPFNPKRPIGRGELPLGCDQQGRYPQAAEPVCDEDELGLKLPPQEPWWPYILGGIVGLLVFALVFGVTLGGKP